MVLECFDSHEKVSTREEEIQCTEEKGVVFCGEELLPPIFINEDTKTLRGKQFFSGGKVCEKRSVDSASG